MRALKLLFLFFLIAPYIYGQAYKQIPLGDKLDNQKIYSLRKGPKGYMWFLAENGVYRYDGTTAKLSTSLSKDSINFDVDENSWLQLDQHNRLWFTDRNGNLFRIVPEENQYMEKFHLPNLWKNKRNSSFSYAFIDHDDKIWLCRDDSIFIYDADKNKVNKLKKNNNLIINDVVYAGKNLYFVGTTDGLYLGNIQGKGFILHTNDTLNKIDFQINELYYNPSKKKLFIGSFQKGMWVYDLNQNIIQPILNDLNDITINRIIPYHDNDLFIATDGAGVYKLNMMNYAFEPFMVTDYMSNTGINSNTIQDIFIDKDRIWLINYPLGITVFNYSYPKYQWIKHSLGDKASLINDQVNAIITDHEGDLWIATNNGISCYYTKKQEWKSYLSIFDHPTNNKNHTFLSLCEIEPGVIWTGGYGSGLYAINKNAQSVNYFMPSSFGNSNIPPDKYIKAIYKDNKGSVWVGGHRNLKEIDYKHKGVCLFQGINRVNCILEKNAKYFWIGTNNGLLLLNRNTGNTENVDLGRKGLDICTLYLSSNKRLFIGTANNGLYEYNISDNSINHYTSENNGLISNTVCAIASDEQRNRLFISTNKGISIFDTEHHKFSSWTTDLGLVPVSFSPNASTLTHDHQIIFGSIQGLIAFNNNITIPHFEGYKIIITGLKIGVEKINDKNSDIIGHQGLDKLKEIRMDYHTQNELSLQISTINFDSPSNINYTWMLEGLDKEWSIPSSNPQIEYPKIPVGKYLLKIKLLSACDRGKVYDERNIPIIVGGGGWNNIGEWSLNIIIILMIVGVIGNYIYQKIERKGINLQYREENLPRTQDKQSNPSNHSNTIFIIDDDSILGNQIIQFLPKECTCVIHNHQHSSSKDIEGIQAAIVIMDADSVIDAIAICSMIKAHFETSHIPIIVVGNELKKQQFDNYPSLASNFILRPISENLLKEAVEEQLEQLQQMRETLALAELEEQATETSEHGKGDANVPMDKIDVNAEFINKVKQYVIENMEQENFNVDTLCAMLNMSRTSFYNKLKALTDKAPADFIRIIKLKQAVKMLKEGELTIMEIAEKTGFNDAKYFREVFKKHYKMSPTQYIQKYNNTTKE